MKFTQIAETAFQEVQLNAGVLLSSFDPQTATLTNSAILGATSGGVSFTATPTYSDYGEDIDNCPKNTLELKKLDSWEAKMSGSFVTVSADLAKILVGAATKDTANNAIKPRNDILESDFTDIWWVGDYSDKNGSMNGGFCAIHLLNGLSTGGFQIQSGDKSKGTFSFEFTGHYSMSAQDTPPFEIYIKAGTAETT